MGIRVLDGRGLDGKEFSVTRRVLMGVGMGAGFRFDIGRIEAR